MGRKIIVLVLFCLILYNPVVFLEEEMKEIKLPEPDLKGEMSLEETIATRRSVRSYTDKELTIDQISNLLWSAQGITGERGRRAAPSAGARYPLEIYLMKKDGLFHYNPEGHKLVLKKPGDLRPGLLEGALRQRFVAQAPVSFIICAVYERVTKRYKRRGIRYTDIEVGHAAQNIHLEAVALGLSSVPVGAFRDEAVIKLLGLPRGEEPVYIIPVGYKK